MITTKKNPLWFLSLFCIFPLRAPKRSFRSGLPLLLLPSFLFLRNLESPTDRLVIPFRSFPPPLPSRPPVPPRVPRHTHTYIRNNLNLRVTHSLSLPRFSPLVNLCLDPFRVARRAALVGGGEQKAGGGGAATAPEDAQGTGNYKFYYSVLVFASHCLSGFVVVPRGG